MKVLRNALVVILGLLFSFSATAQMVEDPTTWSFEAKKTGDNKYDVIVHLKLKEHWHIWSFDPKGDGLQVPPEIKLNKDPKVKPEGKVKEKGDLISKEIDGVDGIVNYFENKVDYVQKISVTGNVKITGSYRYQVCNESMCLPPKTKKFSVEITDAVETAAAADSTQKDSSLLAAGSVGDSGQTGNGGAGIAAADSNKKLPGDNAKSAEGEEGAGEKLSLIWLFLLSLGGGFLAVLTPCVYSMIPITVSFFTKRSKTREEGIRNAIYYALSIIIIFTVLGMAISAIFGVNALNNLSTNWIANLVFFALFMIFGISFLGAFEITLPTSWTNKTDSKANTKSFGGIFFMALTLVIVSFSCTGPIVGGLLVEASKNGMVGPALGMFGFSLGLALPFALFAVFPGLLNKMASSGGWLNQVKVTLGFIEIALALKFLSNADLAKHWRLLDREVFISLWIVLFVLLGLYLLGKLKLSHDDANVKNVYGQEYVSIFKLFLAIGCFSFSVYMVPGLWGAPLNAISAFVPPMGTQDFVMGSGGTGGGHGGNGGPAPVKYVNQLKIYEPEIAVKNGLVSYYDYDEAIAASKALKKPIMLDFTGINCVNCRKMEAQVWSNPEVMKRLTQDFVVASLYCDYDDEDLPKSEQYFSKVLGADVVTVGDKNEALQAEKFNSNSQPFYFYIDANGNKLADKGYGYDPNVQKFIKHLDAVKAKYKELNP
ncbi:MAG: thioredoxin family protein [Flavipsychrobacter sp.]|nr:thioredoxin family protein [Flavipsychrobacter sp.]